MIHICSQKHSSNHHIKWLELFGGDGGIRTHVALITPKRFRVVLVTTTSIRLHILINFLNALVQSLYAIMQSLRARSRG